jgi:hypothetical protein
MRGYFHGEAMSEGDERELEDERDYEAVCGAPDEPIRRQRQTVSHLENIEEALIDQTRNLREQNEKIIGLLERLSTIGWVIAGLVFFYVVWHWK